MRFNDKGNNCTYIQMEHNDIKLGLTQWKVICTLCNLKLLRLSSLTEFTRLTIIHESKDFKN